MPDVAKTVYPSAVGLESSVLGTSRSIAPQQRWGYTQTHIINDTTLHRTTSPIKVSRCLVLPSLLPFHTILIEGFCSQFLLLHYIPERRGEKLRPEARKAHSRNQTVMFFQRKSSSWLFCRCHNRIILLVALSLVWLAVDLTSAFSLVTSSRANTWYAFRGEKGWPRFH